MELVVKEYDRKTKRLVGKWIYHYSVEECLKTIKKLDSKFVKTYHYFKYELKEE